MKKSHVILVLAALGILFALGLGLGWGARRWAAGGGPAAYNTATMLRQVQTLSQLVTVKYVMEKVVVMEDVKWFGESRVLLVANGVVKAGVDFSRLKPEDVRVTEKKIEAWLDEKKIVNLETAGRQISLRFGDIEQSKPLGIATYQTTAALREIKMRRLDMAAEDKK